MTVGGISDRLKLLHTAREKISELVVEGNGFPRTRTVRVELAALKRANLLLLLLVVALHESTNQSVRVRKRLGEVSTHVDDAQVEVRRRFVDRRILASTLEQVVSEQRAKVDAQRAAEEQSELFVSAKGAEARQSSEVRLARDLRGEERNHDA